MEQFSHPSQTLIDSDIEYVEKYTKNNLRNTNEIVNNIGSENYSSINNFGRLI